MAELFVLLLALTAAEESCSEEWRPSCVQPPRLRSGQPALGGDKEAPYPPPPGGSRHSWGTRRLSAPSSGRLCSLPLRSWAAEVGARVGAAR